MSGTMVIAFRTPEHVHEALAAAAKDDLSSPSVVARQAVVRELRRRGYLPEAAPAKAVSRG